MSCFTSNLCAEFYGGVDASFFDQFRSAFNEEFFEALRGGYPFLTEMASMISSAVIDEHFKGMRTIDKIYDTALESRIRELKRK